MTVAVRPQDFAGGAASPDGGGWEIHGVVYQTNPKRLVTAEERHFINAWLAWRGNGFGAGLMPEAGGWNDQGAVQCDLFRIANAQFDELQPKGKADEPKGYD